jgi:hypothetical protein
MLLMLTISCFIFPCIAFAKGDSGEMAMIFRLSKLISPKATEIKKIPFSVSTIAPFSALSADFGRMVFRKSFCFVISFR